jgi:hypothetical protein
LHAGCIPLTPQGQQTITIQLLGAEFGSETGFAASLALSLSVLGAVAGAGFGVFDTDMGISCRVLVVLAPVGTGIAAHKYRARRNRKTPVRLNRSQLATRIFSGWLIYMSIEAARFKCSQNLICWA